MYICILQPDYGNIKHYVCSLVHFASSGVADPVTLQFCVQIVSMSKYTFQSSKT